MSLQMPPWFSPPTQGAGGGAGAGEGAAAKKGRNGDKGDKGDVMKLLTAIGRLALAQARAVATCMVPLSRGLPAATQKAGEKYEEGSKAMRSASATQEQYKQRGPPRIHVFLAAFQHVAERAAVAGQDAEKTNALEAKQCWKNHIASSDMESMAEAVLYFRLQQCLVITNFNKDTRLASMCSPYITQVLDYEGATAVHGSGPRGPLEGEIAKMVNHAK
ncbi:unnamed protein product [Prorocentrum cordatum]|uniref:Uncharacterized protein n=1 Tax=Prorocentrum cordatum TaxID=2364126 RepID=A0ABN9WG77_9DINO|nr:unnamed protein product [Polarella glacialis]